MKNKIIALLLILAISAACFVGCGKSDEPVITSSISIDEFEYDFSKANSFITLAFDIEKENGNYKFSAKESVVGASFDITGIADSNKNIISITLVSHNVNCFEADKALESLDGDASEEDKEIILCALNQKAMAHALNLSNNDSEFENKSFHDSGWDISIKVDNSKKTLTYTAKYVGEEGK